MNKVLSFTWSSNELAKAQNLQRQITQKDLQLTLLEIDNRYKPIFGYYNNSSNMLSLQSISIERNNLIYQRDNCISNAIDHALDIIMDDIQQNINPMFATGNLAINNIASFIMANQISFVLSLSVRIKLSQAIAKIANMGYNYYDLRYKLEKFK